MTPRKTWFIAAFRNLPFKGRFSRASPDVGYSECLLTMRTSSVPAWEFNQKQKNKRVWEARQKKQGSATAQKPLTQNGKAPLSTSAP